MTTRVITPNIKEKVDYLLRNRFPGIYQSLNSLKYSCNRKKMLALYKGTPLPSPLRIKIETLTRCNKKCVFCPVPLRQDNIKDKKMSWDTFNKIISELKNAAFDGEICLNLNNEPLLDTRIPEMITHVRKELPASHIYLITNGLLLNTEITNSLINSGLNKLTINNYNSSDKLLKNIKEIYTEFSEAVCNIEIFLRKETDTLNSEGGYLEQNKGPKQPFNRFCYYPFTELCFIYNGDASICCHDVMYDGIIGKIHNKSILEIWNGKEINEYHNKLLNENRSITPCSKCDFIGYNKRRL